MSRSLAEQSAILDPHHAAALVRARRFGVPRSMIDAVAERRSADDWRGACRTAGVDVRLDLPDLRRRFGRDVVHRLQDDLRHLAPDLLRWHLPRHVHDHGRLRPGLLVPLALYPAGGDALMLAAVTAPPALAAGERLLLVALASSPDGRPTARPGAGGETGLGRTGTLRRGRASRYRLDRHAFTWDVRQAPRLRDLCTGTERGEITRLQDRGLLDRAWAAAGITFSSGTGRAPRAGRAADRRVDRDADRGRRLATRAPVNLPNLAAEARRVWPGVDGVALHLGHRRVVVLTGLTGTSLSARCVESTAAAGLPVLPQAAWSRPADAELVRLGYADPDDLHPLVAAALDAGPAASAPPSEPAAPESITIRCAGSEHRLLRRDDGWQAADHGPDQRDRERRFALLGGPPSACQRQIELMAQDPGLAEEVDLYLRHGQLEAARALVRHRLGAAATLADVTLPDGAPASDAVVHLSDAVLRYRLLLTGVHPRTPTGAGPADTGTTSPLRRRPSRKGPRPNATR